MAAPAFAPCWAGLIAIANELRTNNGAPALNGYTDVLPKLYSLAATQTGDFQTITSGTSVSADGHTSYSVGPANTYNLVTGLGSPVANVLVSDLAGTPAALVDTVSDAVADHQVTVSQNGSNIDIYDNGTLLTSHPVASTGSIDISGGDASGDITLSVDLSGGFSLPLTFDGGSGAGAHTLDIENGSFTNEVETPTSATSGTIQFDQNPVITYTNMNTVDDTATVTGTATFNGTGAGDAISLGDGGTISLLGGGSVQATQLQSGNGDFATIDFANKAKATVQDAGVDTFTIDTTTATVAANLQTLAVDGSAGTGGDVFDVIATAVPTTLDGGGASDTFVVLVRCRYRLAAHGQSGRHPGNADHCGRQRAGQPADRRRWRQRDDVRRRAGHQQFYRLQRRRNRTNRLQHAKRRLLQRRRQQRWRACHRRLGGQHVRRPERTLAGNTTQLDGVGSSDTFIFSSDAGVDSPPAGNLAGINGTVTVVAVSGPGQSADRQRCRQHDDVRQRAGHRQCHRLQRRHNRHDRLFRRRFFHQRRQRRRRARHRPRRWAARSTSRARWPAARRSLTADRQRRLTTSRADVQRDPCRRQGQRSVRFRDLDDTARFEVYHHRVVQCGQRHGGLFAREPGGPGGGLDRRHGGRQRQALSRSPTWAPSWSARPRRGKLRSRRTSSTD